MPTYTGANIKDLSVSTPTEGATPPSEVNDSIREIKTVYKNQNAVASKTADYTLTNADSVIYVSASGGNVILTLPQQSSVSSSTFIKEYIIIRTDTSSNTVTIDPYSTETINGGSTFAIPVVSTSTYPSAICLIGNGGTDWKGIRTEESADVNSVQVFTTTGTWTKPSGVTKVRVQLAAGGGGGGSDPAYAGSGGGAGGYSEEIIDVSAVSTVAVTIGAGGAGCTGIGSDTSGSSGGTTSFGAYLSATGGGGGSNSSGGDSGSGSGGNINISGGDGDTHGGQSIENSGGTGGASYFGGGGKGGNRAVTQTGVAGKAYGSGGGGGTTGYSSGAGKAGIVIVYEY